MGFKRFFEGLFSSGTPEPSNGEQIEAGLLDPCGSCGADNWRPATPSESEHELIKFKDVDGDVLIAVCCNCGQTMAVLNDEQAAALGDVGSDLESSDRVIMAFRNLEIARKFPLFTGEESNKKSDEPQSCEQCGEEMQPVVLTTGSMYGDPAAWEAYPLAVDGWRCEQCEQFIYPAFLSPDEITELQDRAVRCAQSGNMDEAEFLLRRCVNSWPHFSPALVNLASVHLDKIKLEQSDANREELIDRWANTARELLSRSLEGEPPSPEMVYLMLGRIEMRLGNVDRAAELLKQFLAFEGLEEPLRAQAQALLDENQSSR